MQFFVGLNSFGVLDEDGNVVDAELIDYAESLHLSDPDKPLEMVTSMLAAWCPMWRYSTPEAAQADINNFRDFVDSFDYEYASPPWELN